MKSGNDRNREGEWLWRSQTDPTDVYRPERSDRSSYMPMKCTVVVTKVMYFALNTDSLVLH